MSNPNVTCKICNGTFPRESFTAHLRKEKITIENYCLQYYPKKDLLTGEVLPFKDKESYFVYDFLNKANMLKWIKAQTRDVVFNYCVGKLTKYKEAKKITSALTHFELRTISFLPSVRVLDKIEKGLYDKISHACGLPTLEYSDNNLKEVFKGEIIMIDKREQRKLNIVGSPTIDQSGKWGDYSIDGKFAVERKSVSDLLGTLSKGYERFEKEMDRCQLGGGAMVILIEEDINKVLAFEHNSRLHTKASKEFIFHRIRELQRHYPFIQFLAVDGRKEAARVCQKILNTGLDIMKYDLQYLYEEKKL